MSNPVEWRRKPRTSVPNSRQKRNGLFLDAHPVCQGCYAATAKHAHHMLDDSFACRRSWYAMRPLCEPCHVAWHRPLLVTFQINGVVIGRVRVSAHDRIQFSLAPLPAA